LNESIKKLALTNLVVLIAIKSVSACTYAVDPNNPVRDIEPKVSYDLIFFFSAFVLILPILILFFLRKQKGLWAVIASIVLLLLFIPAIFLTAFVYGICDNNDAVSNVIKAELFLMLLIFTIQLFSWISQRKTSIKLQ
jgi:hypothetical protein